MCSSCAQLQLGIYTLLVKHTPRGTHTLLSPDQREHLEERQHRSLRLRAASLNGRLDLLPCCLGLCADLLHKRLDGCWVGFLRAAGICKRRDCRRGGSSCSIRGHAADVLGMSCAPWHTLVPRACPASHDQWTAPSRGVCTDAAPSPTPQPTISRRGLQHPILGPCTDSGRQMWIICRLHALSEFCACS